MVGELVMVPCGVLLRFRDQCVIYASLGHLGFPRWVYGFDIFGVDAEGVEEVVYGGVMSLHIVSGGPFDSGV